jgi:hypothetical protein
MDRGVPNQARLYTIATGSTDAPDATNRRITRRFVVDRFAAALADPIRKRYV